MELRKLGGSPAPPESEKLTEVYASKSRSLPEEWKVFGTKNLSEYQILTRRKHLSPSFIKIGALCQKLFNFQIGGNKKTPCSWEYLYQKNFNIASWSQNSHTNFTWHFDQYKSSCHSKFCIKKSGISVDFVLIQG